MELMKHEAIVVDIDGTLANVEHRVHHLRQPDGKKNWRAFHSALVKDELNVWCSKLIHAMKGKGLKIVLLTGRDDSYKPETLEWLEQNKIEYDALFMRKARDSRADYEIKKEIFLQQIAPFHDVLFVVEDRKSVVEMWREIGVVCLQCDWGDF